MKKPKIITLLLIFSFIFSGFSQEKKDLNLSILVKNKKNKPIAGAIILLDNVKQKRTTNSKGYFKIKLKKAPKSISAFYPTIGIKEITYSGNEEVILIIKKGNKKIFVNNPSVIKEDEMIFENIYDYLRGKVSGVTIIEDNTIIIRGVGTILGSTEPLYVLNGTPIVKTTFENIIPVTIKHVKILKGPDAAIYGSRGANGVIEVTTF